VISNDGLLFDLFWRKYLDCAVVMAWYWIEVSTVGSPGLR
jgi:hypothetical protein